MIYPLTNLIKKIASRIMDKNPGRENPVQITCNPPSDSLSSIFCRLRC